MKKKPQPRYKIGEQVRFRDTTYTIVSYSWNGITYMYGFDGTDMRCGESYLTRTLFTSI